MEYRIGDFSMVTRLSIKTLRYYHEIGLLEPCRIDAVSGYRWYDETAIHKAACISLLKELEFSLDEIREIISQKGEDQDFSGFLKNKIYELDKKIDLYRGIKGQLYALLNTEPGVKEMKTINESVSWTYLEETKAATIRFKGKYSEVGTYFTRLFKAYGRFAAGAPFTLYHDPEFRESEADMEACLPLRSSASVGSRDEAEVKILPSIKAAQILHRGGYDILGNSYKKIFDFLTENKATAAVPSREIYLKGPGMIFPRNPKNYLTMIQVPVQG